jgi:hypothetical protein
MATKTVALQAGKKQMFDFIVHHFKGPFVSFELDNFVKTYAS